DLDTGDFRVRPGSEQTRPRQCGEREFSKITSADHHHALLLSFVSPAAGPVEPTPALFSSFRHLPTTFNDCTRESERPKQSRWMWGAMARLAIIGAGLRMSTGWRDRG